MKKIICLFLILTMALLGIGCDKTQALPDEQEGTENVPPVGNITPPVGIVPEPPEDDTDPTISTKLVYDLDLILCLNPFDRLLSCRGPEDRLIPGKATISAVYQGHPVLSIWSGAFAGCKNLTEVVVQEGIESIHDQAFTFASGLQKLTLPVSIKSIGMEAFAGCTSLTEITFQGTKAQWEDIQKGENWALNITSCVIRCHDGNIQLNPPSAQ